MSDNILVRAADSLADFLRFAAPHLQETVPGTLFYGTGEAAHWAVQSSLNVCRAFAVAAEIPAVAERLGTTSAELRETALRLFRYALRTHLSGDAETSAGIRWGCHWISVLGLERMTHGLDLLEPHFSDDDRARWRALRRG